MNDIVMKFDRVFCFLRGNIRPHTYELGLGPGQPRVLMYLQRFGESYQRDVAEYYQIDPGNVSRMVENLLKNGFITQRQCPSDRRANSIAITEKGSEVINKWCEYLEAAEDKMLSSISDEEKSYFSAILSRIENNFKEGAE